jgi:DedD protein
MGIFSFGKKDDAPTRRGANTSSTRAPRGERVERRTRRTERPVDADAMLLDPTLPEKQRARRRLVGAIALVVAAVIILPMVLDSHPKPVTDDISIDIPSRPAPKVAKAPVEDTQAGVAPDNPTPDAGLAASALAPAPATTAKSGQSDETRSSASTNTAPATKPVVKPQAPVVAANTAPAAPVTTTKPATRTPATHSTVSTATAAATPDDEDTSPAAASADANSGTPASPPGSRFAVQLGAFADDANARNWASRLKAAGVPAYTEHRKQADGSTLTLLRAGPFADRAAATAAIAKVRAAGLTSGANSSNSSSTAQ